MSTSSTASIDRRVQGAESLVSSLSEGTEWLFLDTARDGIEQMRQALAGLSGLQPIHRVSNGSARRVLVGAMEFSSATLVEYAQAVVEIACSQGSGGCILFYGSSVAQG